VHVGVRADAHTTTERKRTHALEAENITRTREQEQTEQLAFTIAMITVKHTRIDTRLIETRYIEMHIETHLYREMHTCKGSN